MGKKQRIIWLPLLVLFSACWSLIDMNTVSPAVRLYELRADTYYHGALDKNWGEYIDKFPYLHDYREARPWIGVSLSNKYGEHRGEGYSTEVSYWLYHIEKEKYWGPFSRESYEDFIAQLELTEELTLATWEEILKLDYNERLYGFDHFRTPRGFAYYFDRYDSFSDPPQKIVEKKKEYFDKKVIPDGIAPYTTRHPYPDAERPWLSEDSGECSWQLKHNRRNYFNNFYRDFGFGGDINRFRIRAGELDPRGLYHDMIVESLLLIVKNLTEEEKKRFAHYARQLEAMQQAFNNGDTAELKRLEDQALAESERNYPCP